MTPDQLKTSIAKNLSSIRKILDTDVTGTDIESVVEKGKLLTQLSGTAAESKSQAVKLLKLKELEVLSKIKDSGLQPSIVSKMLDAECYEEHALFTYADRINASISHSVDYLRTVISLHKSEIENSLKNV